MVNFEGAIISYSVDGKRYNVAIEQESTFNFVKNALDRDTSNQTLEIILKTLTCIDKENDLYECSIDM